MNIKPYLVRKNFCLFFFLAAFLLLPLTSSAQSLWTDGQSMQGNGLFADKQARNVGDVITIIINENTVASTTGNAQNSKNSNVNLGAGLGWLDFLELTGGSYNDTFRAQGSQTNTNRVQGRVTVTVKEVRPGGLLFVSGTQTIKQNKEEQKITITGLVRPEDVSYSNTVLSSLVADASIQIESKGPIGKKQRQGIISQIFNFLF
jgi:flagellar L-ring protein precursor FlgH